MDEKIEELALMTKPRISIHDRTGRPVLQVNVDMQVGGATLRWEWEAAGELIAKAGGIEGLDKRACIVQSGGWGSSVEFVRLK